jgi:hypothetical protein
MPTVIQSIAENINSAVWGKAIIIPILKVNKLVSELPSYYPMSLTSILAETVEKNGQCKTELIPRNETFITDTRRLQTILLNKPANCYA